MQLLQRNTFFLSVKPTFLVNFVSFEHTATELFGPWEEGESTYATLPPLPTSLYYGFPMKLWLKLRKDEV